MSGGSMDYMFSTIENYAEHLKDYKMIDLAKDLAKVFHDCEWFESGDISEGEYNKSILNFKEKWFKEGSQEKRIEQYIRQAMSDVRKKLGVETYCGECAKFKADVGKQYGDKDWGTCSHYKHCLTHKYEYVCEEFERVEEYETN